MKKYLLSMVSIISCLACDRGNDVIEIIDYEFGRRFIVENNTSNSVIVITSQLTYGPNDIVINLAPTKSTMLFFTTEAGRLSEKNLEDDLDDHDSPLFAYGNRDEGITGYFVSMTIDGEVVSNDVMLRQYWSFSSDFYNRAYTLTITDELLAGLEE
jgi:hypothetical protein